MAQRTVLVKRLVAIEDLGDADVLFTDKTGTLTEGEIRYREGVDPTGAVRHDLNLQGLFCSELDFEHGGDAAREHARPRDLAQPRAKGRRSRAGTRRPRCDTAVHLRAPPNVGRARRERHAAPALQGSCRGSPRPLRNRSPADGVRPLAEAQAQVEQTLVRSARPRPSAASPRRATDRNEAALRRERRARTRAARLPRLRRPAEGRCRRIDRTSAASRHRAEGPHRRQRAHRRPRLRARSASR